MIEVTPTDHSSTRAYILNSIAQHKGRFAMTTLDTSITIQDLVEDFRRSSRSKQQRLRLRMLPMVHLLVVSGVAIFCMNLVR